MFCIYKTHSQYKYKMYFQNEKMAELWVFIDFSNKRRLEIIYKTSFQNETVRWITRRSCCWKVFHKKVVPKSFTKFTWKHLSWSLFFSQVVGLRSETLLKRLQYRCSQKNFMKFFKNAFKRTPLAAASVQKMFVGFL